MEGRFGDAAGGGRRGGREHAAIRSMAVHLVDERYHPRACANAYSPPLALDESPTPGLGYVYHDEEVGVGPNQLEHFCKAVLNGCDGADRRPDTSPYANSPEDARPRGYALSSYLGKYLTEAQFGSLPESEKAPDVAVEMTPSVGSAWWLYRDTDGSPYSLPHAAYGESGNADRLVRDLKTRYLQVQRITESIRTNLPPSLLGDPPAVEDGITCIDLMCNPPDGAHADTVHFALQLRNKLVPRLDALDRARLVLRELRNVRVQGIARRSARAALHGGQGALMRLLTAEDLWTRIIDLGELESKDAARLLRTCKFDATIRQLLRSRLPHLHVYNVQALLRPSDGSVLEAAFPHHVRVEERGVTTRELHADKLIHLCIGFGRMLSRDQVRAEAHKTALGKWREAHRAELHNPNAPRSGPAPTLFDPEVDDPKVDTGYGDAERLLYCRDAARSDADGSRQAGKDRSRSNSYTKRVPELDGAHMFVERDPLHYFQEPPAVTIELVHAGSRQVMAGGLVPQHKLAASGGKMRLCPRRRMSYAHWENGGNWPLPTGPAWGEPHQRALHAKYKLAPAVLSSMCEHTEFRLKITATGARVRCADADDDLTITHYTPKMRILSSARAGDSAARAAAKRRRFK